jgi:hypothetical protein
MATSQRMPLVTLGWQSWSVLVVVVVLLVVMMTLLAIATG